MATNDGKRLGDRKSRSAGTSTPRERGARGNKRGKEAQARRRENRLAKPRVQTALAEASANRRWLDALEAADRAEREAAALVIRATRSKPAEPVEVLARLALDDPANRTRGDRGWSLGQARMLILDGYAVRWVCERTGFGGYWFEDLLGPDGYFRPHLELAA